MRIVIDGRMLYWTGVGRYTQALLKHLETIDRDNQYTVLVRRKDWGLWSPEAANFSKVEVNIDPYTLSEQLELPRVLLGLKPDLVHFPAANTPLLWRGPRVVTVHDLTLIDYDTSRHEGWRRQLWQLKRLMFRLVFWNNARFATRLMTDTNYVKDQLVARYRIPASCITPAWLGVDPALAEPEPLDRFNLAGKYLLYIGNAFPYKNIAATIRALAKLAKAYPELELVVAGKRDAFSQQQEELAHELGVGKRVKFVGFVSDGELVSLYRGAAVYVNPSLSEGFGLQGLEAMAQGAPVVSARASCLPEVYGEAAEYFNATDVDDQAVVIARVLDDEDVAGKLRAAGHEHIKMFSWQHMAEQTLGAYRAAASKGRGETAA